VRARGDKTIEFQATARIDTPEELVAFRHGGILPYVLRQHLAASAG
jgi:aconitate hydratase